MPSSPKKRKPTGSEGVDDTVAMEILKSIRRILRKTAEHSRQLAKDAGLNTPQLLCLRAISERAAGGEVTVVGVAEAVQMSPATVARILDRLEQSGLAVRQRTSADRRKVLISLTELGRRELKRSPTPLQDQFLARLRQLTPAEQQAVLAGLRQVVEMMGAAEIDASPVLTTEVDVKLAAKRP